MPTRAAAATPPPSRLPRIVWLLGLVSLCNDFASEMVVPLVPLLLATLGAAPAVWIGIIEGSADALASVLKRWSGRRADRGAGSRDRLTLGGYVLSNAARPLLALVGSATAVLGVRLLDRVGKGLRSAPRDALLAVAVTPAQRGAAFGLHRAFDNAGAVLGALAAAGLLILHGQDLRAVVWWSLLPGLASVAWLLAALRQARRDAAVAVVVAAPAAPTHADAAGASAVAPEVLRRRARSVLEVVALYTLLRLPEALLLLRGHELGLVASQVLLLWAGYSAAKAATGHIGGRLGDRHGQARWLVRAWLGMAAALLLLATASTPSGLWAGAVLFGLVFGAAEGGERALVAEVAAPGALGRGFGNYHMATGLAAIPGGLLLGLVWTRFGAPAAFALSGAGLALCALWLTRLPPAQADASRHQSV
jgi:MFS family permease